MTYERPEFVTNAYIYKHSAIAANFERMSNIFLRKHTRYNFNSILFAIRRGNCLTLVTGDPGRRPRQLIRYV